ncbi:MAG: acetolactate synthase small subunit [Pseudomonadota bacterium]
MASVYAPNTLVEEEGGRTIAAIVDNEPGVLARVVGLFSARGYNIESLTVAETDAEKRRSRITVVTSGTPHTLDQLKSQLQRLVPVQKVVDVTLEPAGLERELALIKVQGTGEKRVEALRLSDAFRANVLDTTHTSFIFELTGAKSKIDAFIDLMKPLGLIEVSRTGLLSIQRGSESA